MSTLRCMKTALLSLGLLLVLSPSARADEDLLPGASAFPKAASIKGLQVEHVGDALALGVKHAALNFNLSQLIDPDRLPGNPTIESGGRTYAFKRLYLEAIDTQVRELSKEGVLVYLIVLACRSHRPEVNRIALHPGYDEKAPNKIGAFNTGTEVGRGWLRACFELMAERWSSADGSGGRVVGYVLGNEVNAHWWWCNMGRVSLDEFVREYALAARIAHDALRRHASWPRLYVSLEHHWTLRGGHGDDRQGFPGREFLLRFAEQVGKGGDFDWHVAYHPYPENLFEPRFWNDKTALPGPDTPRITFRNLEVLPRFLNRPELLFEGRPRRIVLSEQGFHTPDGPEGERVQAAAYCYAYKKVESLPSIDAFILHRHIDHPHEGGLWLGLRRRGSEPGKLGPKKPIYECFRLADTPSQEAAFRFALPVVGLERWP